MKGHQFLALFVIVLIVGIAIVLVINNPAITGRQIDIFERLGEALRPKPEPTPIPPEPVPELIPPPPAAGIIKSISSCGTLTQPGTAYLLQSDVEAAGTCFIVQADDVMLDCQNHIITYAISVPGDGIYSDKSNTVVRNCIFKKG